MTTCKSVLAILVSPTNPKVIAVVSITLSSILLTSYFFPSTITGVVIVLHSEVFSTYILI
jgi:hypothetical protein